MVTKSANSSTEVGKEMEVDPTKARLSRRDFLKAGSFIGGSTLLAGMAGCVADPNENFSSANQETKWDYETDVVVVGSGVAGCSAAVEALEAGSHVILIEQYESTGGASSASGVIQSWGSKLNLPQLVDIQDNADIMYADMVKIGETADPELLRVICDRCVEGIDFLIDHGVAFANTLRMTEGRQGQGAFSYESMGGGSVTLLGVLESLGGEVFTSTKLSRIIRNETLDNRCVGIEATDADDKAIFIRANQAVIVATGTWMHDRDMVIFELPTIDLDGLDARIASGSRGIPFGLYTADSQRVALAAGANLRHMSFIGFSPYFSTIDYLKQDVARDGLTRQADELHINLDGLRFGDESAARPTVAANILRQTKGQYLVIEDSHWIPSRKMPSYTEETLVEWIDKGFVIKADSLEDLVVGIESTWGVPADILLETVATYNTYCDSGVDPDFNKPACFMTKVDSPPFYAGPTMTAYIDMTFGGISTNAQAQVLDIYGDSISGLYAAGTCTGGHFGKAAPMGSYQILAVVFGRIAGQNAAKETALA